MESKSFEKTKAELGLLTDIDMLLLVEKAKRGEICHSIHRYPKANDKYMKDYDKNKELSYLQYRDVNNLYCWVMSQKLPVNHFEWIEDTPQFMFNILKNYMNFIMIYHYYLWG